MRFHSFHSHVLTLLAGAFVLAGAGRAFSEETPAAGVIRITDAGGAPAMPAAKHDPHAQNCAPAQPHVVDVGPGFEFDGNPFHDLCTSMNMRLHAHQMRRRAELGHCGDCRECQSGTCRKHDCCLKDLWTARPEADDWDARARENDFDGVDSDGDGYDYDYDPPGPRYPGYGERYTAEQWRQNLEYFKYRYGYFVPHGEVPTAGHYSMAYAVNPDYWDKRDSGPLYSAEGYGVPMAMPLAPVVTRYYNYGWGIPSSRLTPVSRLVPQQHLPPVR